MSTLVFPPQPVVYQNGISLVNILKANIAHNPLNLMTLIIFVLAIIHTLFAHQITQLADKLAQKWDLEHPNDRKRYSFAIEMLIFLGEVEVVFALWLIPLFVIVACMGDWKMAIHYLEGVRFAEPLFVVIIMIIAATKPILALAEWCLSLLAKLFKGSISSWWFIILTFSPFFGSVITEPGAMTLGALLLKDQFYKYNPSKKLAYATIGLLFVHVSVGGVLTNFAAPPVLMVAQKWGWSSSFMFHRFGIKAIASILISNLVYLWFFSKEFKSLKLRTKKILPRKMENIPRWITLTHIVFLFSIVFFAHYSILIIGIILLFIAFHRATTPYQDRLQLRGPILVGMFLAGLVVHGNLQGWWIEPIIKKLSPAPLMIAAAGLTSFNDNALLTYLSALIPDLSSTLQYAVVAGAVAGGGLTVIANAPNPAGQFLLKEHFEGGVAPWNLFLGALFPSLVILGIFLIFI